MSKYSLPIGLNKSVNVFPEYKKYSQTCDGKMVYVEDGKIHGISSGTKLRGAKVLSEFEILQELAHKLPTEQTFVFLVTYSQIIIVNMDFLETVYPTIIFIGVFDTDGKYTTSQESLEIHKYCTFSTRAEALGTQDSEKIHILPLLSKEDALVSFNKQEDLIGYGEDNLPVRFFDEEHENRRNALSGTQNPFQCFVRFLVSMMKESISGNDKEMMELIINKIPQAEESLRSIQCQTDWSVHGSKVLENTKYLLDIKHGFYKRKPIMYTEYGKTTSKRQLPYNFLNIYNMKIADRGFLAKVFYNSNNAYKLLNKIRDYKVSN